MKFYIYNINQGASVITNVSETTTITTIEDTTTNNHEITTSVSQTTLVRNILILMLLFHSYFENIFFVYCKKLLCILKSLIDLNINDYFIDL